MTKKYTRDLSHAICRCLRWSSTLPTSTEAFAWIDDATYAIWEDPRTYSSLKRRATTSEVLYCVSVAEPGRFQVTFLSDSGADYTALIRTVQGHGGLIHSRIKAADAFDSAADVETLVHYTSQMWLPQIRGFGSPGLIPGGCKAKGATYTFRSSALLLTALCPRASRSGASMLLSRSTSSRCAATSR